MSQTGNIAFCEISQSHNSGNLQIVNIRVSENENHN